MSRLVNPQCRVALLLLVAVLLTPACLVVSLDRFYDDASITFDEHLLGSWVDTDDNVTAVVERSEWRSYRIEYTHPTEKGTLTAYLFRAGSASYLDLTEVRGVDLGSFVMPVHALVKVEAGAEALTLTPLRFDWFDTSLTANGLPKGLNAARAERGQIVLTAPQPMLERWLAGRRAADPAFGTPVVFRKAGTGP